MIKPEEFKERIDILFNTIHLEEKLEPEYIFELKRFIFLLGNEIIELNEKLDKLEK